jgi:hypothetical protein
VAGASTRIQEVGPEILSHLKVRSGESLVRIEGFDEETRARFERLGLEPDEVTRAEQPCPHARSRARNRSAGLGLPVPELIRPDGVALAAGTMASFLLELVDIGLASELGILG